MRWSNSSSCVAAAPLLIAAAQPVRLQPSSPWVRRLCRKQLPARPDIRRRSAVGEAGVPKPGARRNQYAARRQATGNQHSSTVWATFLAGRQQTAGGNVGETVTRGDPAMLWSSVPMLPDATAAKIKAEEDQRHRQPKVRPPAVSLDERASRRAQRQAFASAATELEVFTRSDRTVMLETGSLGDPFAAFDKCSRDSLSDWGIDPGVRGEDRSRCLGSELEPVDHQRRLSTEHVGPK